MSLAAHIVLSIVVALWMLVSMTMLLALALTWLEMPPEEQAKRPLVVWAPATLLFALVFPIILAASLILLTMICVAAWFTGKRG